MRTGRVVLWGEIANRIGWWEPLYIHCIMESARRAARSAAAKNPGLPRPGSPRLRPGVKYYPAPLFRRGFPGYKSRD